MSSQQTNKTNETNGRSKTLYVEMTPVEHGVLRVEAAISGKTMRDIVRSQLIEPLKEKHKVLFARIGGKERKEIVV